MLSLIVVTYQDTNDIHHSVMIMPRNVKIIGFGKAVLGMVTALEQLLGNHISEGVVSIPVGSLEAARRIYPDHRPQENSKIRSMCTERTMTDISNFVRSRRVERLSITQTILTSWHFG